MSGLAQTPTEERRASPRRKSLKKGVIVFKDRYCSTECTIRNESDSGALLAVSQNQVIPNSFELKIYPERDFRIAEVVWRTPDMMGIRYPNVANDTDPQAANGWNGVDRRAPTNRRTGERRQN